jgi:hypothetical protein
MSPYVEQQLNLHYNVLRAKSPFVQMGLDEARAKKMIRSFQAITKKLSKYKHFMSMKTPSRTSIARWPVFGHPSAMASR